MSGHRRVKNINYDDADDYGDYAEDDYGEVVAPAPEATDELTEDDKEQLALGTAKVRSILGDSSHVPHRAIEDALWNYYYDVEKTVTYLKNECKPKTPKQPKTPSRFDQAAAASAEKAAAPVCNGESSFDYELLGWEVRGKSATSRVGGSTARPTEASRRIWNAAIRPRNTIGSPDFFAGISWEMDTLPRRTTFEPVERRPRLHLFGGSGKPSKLAALAAARRAKDKENGALPRSGGQTNGIASLLDNLGKETMKGSSAAGINVRPETPGPKIGAKIGLPPRIRKVDSPAKPLNIKQETHSPIKVEDMHTNQPSVATLRSEPSIFACTMCGMPTRKRVKLSGDEYKSRIALALFGTADLPSQAGFSTLSPDAIVLQAQAKGKVNGHSTKDSKEVKSTKQATKGVENLSINQVAASAPVRVKSKNLNVPFEYTNSKPRRELNFVVVGHIDHGKSTLMGRLLYEHNVIDTRSLEKFKREAAKLGKESFHLAWVMDAREDEREHGVTIDYAEKSFSTANTDFTVIDAPGHRDFVGNMIAGTSMADFALLVVDAGANSFAAGMKGQTREHAQVLRCMKLERLIVAVNKMDSVSWSREAFDSVVQQTTSFLESQLFAGPDIVFVPVAGLTGENITRAVSSDKADWYAGPTLVQALDTISPRRETYLGSISAPFRLRIAAFTGLSEWAEFLGPSAHETLTVHGRVDAGNVQVGDWLVARPSGAPAVVKGIVRRGEPVDYAVPGQIVGLQLVGCDEERLARGDVLSRAADDAPAVVGVLVGRNVTMKVLAFATLFPMPLDVHRGRMRVGAVVADLVALLDRKTYAPVKAAPKRVKAGEVARVKVVFDEAVAIERGERVVLRYGGETVAAGAVERVEDW